MSDPLRLRKPHRKLRLRSVSAGLRDIVASNSYQRPCFLYDFLGTFATSNDIAAIRPHLWSFSLALDGWYRAYCALIRAARRRQSLNGLLQAESTQHRLLGVQVPHAIIRFTAEHLAVGVSGEPLEPRKWWIQGCVTRGILLSPLSSFPALVTAVLEEEGPKNFDVQLNWERS